MAKPVILAVDDDPQVLRAVERDLRRRYAREYRILRADSGESALDTLGKLKLRGDPVALFLVDQRMPKMTGVEFLEQAIERYPEAKCALLTAYSDTEAAIRAINEVGLDYYLQKPWDPPDENLYPNLDDMLGDWQADYRPPFTGLRVIGDRWSPDSHRTREFLALNRVPYRWLDIEGSEEAREILAHADSGAPKLPLVVYEDGSYEEAPQNREIAEKIGLQTRAGQQFYDLVIVGGGPSGLADGTEISCYALIITTGVSYRKLDVPGVDRLTGRGIYYGAAQTEALSCKGEDVFIVGGANSAGQAAMFFSNRARRVFILYRGGDLRKSMSDYLVRQIEDRTNIEVLLDTNVVSVEGEEHLERITAKNTVTGETETTAAHSLFIFIGAAPKTEWLDGVVERDPRGFILSGPDLMHEGKRPKGWRPDRDPFLLETSMPGIFVAGDVRHGSVKRCASAVGEGSIAIQFVHQYLREV